MRLIDADALCTFANNQKDKSIDANDIMRFPTIDAVPVVRCKECKHSYPSTYIWPDEILYACDTNGDNYVHPNDFCSYGEKLIGGEADDQPGAGVTADG